MVTYHYLTILHGNQSLSDNFHGYVSLSANRETRCPSLECCGSDREVGLQINPFTRVFGNGLFHLCITLEHLLNTVPYSAMFDIALVLHGPVFFFLKFDLFP